MKNNNSDYKKTFFYQSFLENNVVVSTLEYPKALVEYIELLIYDVVEKRNLQNKKIVFLTDNLWTKQLLKYSLQSCKLLKNGFINDTKNQIAFVIISDDLDDIIFEIISCDINENLCEPDTFILIDFGVIIDESFDILERLRDRWKNTQWIGVEICNEKNQLRIGILDDEKIHYLPNLPETFVGFVNNDVLKGIKRILGTFSKNDDVDEFIDELNGNIFENERDGITINIGTSDYVDNNEDENEDDDDEDDDEDENEDDYENDSKPFLVTIAINKIGLEFSIELQDYNMDGITYLNYQMNFEEDINEEGNINDIDDLIEEICERINASKINTSLQ